MKPIEYTVANANDLGDLESRVTKLLAAGWQLYGDLQVVCPLVNESPAPAYYQAMVREG